MSFLLYKEYLTEDEAAEYFGIAPDVLRHGQDILGIKAYRLPGTIKRIYKACELCYLDKETIQEYGKLVDTRLWAFRRRYLLIQTPKWVDLDKIRAIRAECRRISKETGIKHHVDHIIPLKGRLVSGLHVAENMQIIPASENFRKLNRYKP